MEELHLPSPPTQAQSSLHRTASSPTEDYGLLLISSIYLQGQGRADDLLLNCIRCPLPSAKTGLRAAGGEVLGTSSHCTLGTACLKALRGKAGVTTLHLHLSLPHTVKLAIRLPASVYLFSRQSCSVALAGLEPDVQTAESSTSAVRLLLLAEPQPPHTALH